MAPVADVVKTGMGDATKVATGAQNMISGTVTGDRRGIQDIGHGVGGESRPSGVVRER